MSLLSTLVRLKRCQVGQPMIGGMEVLSVRSSPPPGINIRYDAGDRNGRDVHRNPTDLVGSMPRDTRR